MPMLPGWLGRLIDARNAEGRRQRARQRLLELGVARGDLEKLLCPYERKEWFGKLVRKYRYREKKEK
jgi:hypothetical protein